MSLNSCLTYLHLFATLLWLTFDFSATICAHLYFWMTDLWFNCTCSWLTYDLSVTRLSFWWRLSKTRYIWFAEENKPVDCQRTTENKVFIAYMNMPFIYSRLLGQLCARCSIWLLWKHSLKKVGTLRMVILDFLMERKIIHSWFFNELFSIILSRFLNTLSVSQLLFQFSLTLRNLLILKALATSSL